MYPKIECCVCEKQFHSSNSGVRCDDLFASCFSGTQQDSALKIKYYQCSSQIENKSRFCNFDVFQVTGNIVITGHFSGLICLWNQDEGDMIDACENAHSNRVSEIGRSEQKKQVTFKNWPLLVKNHSFCPIIMKLVENDQLTRQSFSPSFIKIGQKLLILY